MTIEFRKGRFGVRVARDAADLAACQALRHQCFFNAPGQDADAFDALCAHVMIAGDAGLVGTFRLQHLTAATLHQSYAAQSYDLARLRGYDRPMLELGRFCIAPAALDSDVLRLAWGALAQTVDRDGIGLLFGCSSFAGTDATPYRDAFGLLAARFQAPQVWAPSKGAEETVDLLACAGDRRAGVAALPPLLRSYLSMGGWVSDHAVVDRVMNTLHVFTGLEIDRIPPTRAAALRAVTG